MSDTVIKVENLSKQYRLGNIGTGTLRSDVQRFWANLLGKEDPTLKIGSENSLQNQEPRTKNQDEYVWALKDINFEVQQGEVLGIIGKNGAGKSTLLKILSQVTTPSKGEVKVKGRIASLLEVGTGFHAELTGRENIFLNGAILGMTKTEIKSKFDEIVDFSGVAKYIDTPVKRYSSGMYVRLAFGVAAHLDPEILIVDEVLAVGDTIFQKKAAEKMMKIKDTGRTILFVSHNLALVRSLCDKGIILDNGKMSFEGSCEMAIAEYVRSNETLTGQQISLAFLKRDKSYKENIIYSSFEFMEFPVKFGNPIVVKFTLKSNVTSNFRDVDFGLAINDRNNNCIIHCSNRFVNTHINHTDDRSVYEFSIENCLKPGTYTITLFLRTGDTIQDWLKDIIRFEVLDGNPYGFHNSELITGVVFPKFNFNMLNE